MKSEPDSFGIADLARVDVEPWSGVRSSYFARAHMRAMTVGDAVLFHHSSVTPPGVVGLATVVATGVVDQTQFDPESKYYDPKATREAPIWDCVDVAYVETLPHMVTMDRLRAEPALAGMLVLQRRDAAVCPAGDARALRGCCSARPHRAAARATQAGKAGRPPGAQAGQAARRRRQARQADQQGHAGPGQKPARKRKR